jgi:uncharacterized protein (TIGR03437 family)
LKSAVLGELIENIGRQGEQQGLDQIKLRLPKHLRGGGEVALNVFVDGRQANTLKINVR